MPDGSAEQIRPADPEAISSQADVNLAENSQRNLPSTDQAEQDDAAAAEQHSIVVEDDGSEPKAGPSLPYVVVAIGASAGGVEAYIDLFRSLSPDTGMAYVIIPHLMPDHKSHLVEILSRITRMPVTQIEDGSQPLPDHLYLLPPGRQARLEHGTFKLEIRPHDGVPRPIDYFFRSLAIDQKTNAIGVVLSGTDADGALGLKIIKGEGGIVLVQSPESARFSEMPRNSISIDHVDKILPPVEIAAELALLAAEFRSPALRVLEENVPSSEEMQYIPRILDLLRGVSGIDFRLYKPTTIRRRIARRILLRRVHTIGEYARLLQRDNEELRQLQEDALISVTRFFRDPPVFDALMGTVFPRIMEGHGPDDQIRIWVPGCSSGEETYSIAICLAEFLTAHNIDAPIQLFGTDASEQNIQKARAGVFTNSITAEVSPERLERFFLKTDKGYQVNKRIRDLCIFARQNLCYDPPFSKLDLISCRNVLIYLGADLQKQTLRTLHYALRANGYLLLGMSETIREFTDLFQMIDRKSKLFIKIDTPFHPLPNFTERLILPDIPPPQNVAANTHSWSELEQQRAADRIVMARYGPPGLMVNDKLEIIQSRGHTSPYVEMAQGTATLQLRRMLRQEIADQVINAVRHAIEQDVPVQIHGLRVTSDAGERDISVEVLPIHASDASARSFLILFLLSQKPAADALLAKNEEPVTLTPAERDPIVARLRQDLASNKSYLQTLLEERDAKNQELLSANEEIQSANEEMQSTNEELETTKEELQSSNEELQTVNDELQQRNAALIQSGNDILNLLNSVNLPVLMLSSELLIRQFTPPSQKLMNLRAADVGRPFSDIRVNLKVDNLEFIFREVIETLTPREMEVQDYEGRWYLLRIRPYRTNENRIEGLVLVMLDIDELRQSQQNLRAARDFATSVIANVPLPLAVLDMDLKIRSINNAFRTLSKLSEGDPAGRSLTELTAQVRDLDEPLRARLNDLQTSTETDGKFEFEYRSEAQKSTVFKIRGRVLQADSQKFLLITVEDISPQKELEHLMTLERERLAREVASKTRELGRTQDELRALAGSLFTSQEDERRRVARELHDDITQKLAALQLQVEQMDTPIGALTEPDHAIEKLRQELMSVSEDIRRISHDLHPAVMEHLGLTAALQSLTDDFRDREHMIATFTAQDVPESISSRIAIGLYRITQEALRNVSKHAGRTHLKVVVKGEPGQISLRIMDFGHGFDMSEDRSGLGLISMEERARLIGGALRVESAPGKGTTVAVEVPLPQ